MQPTLSRDSDSHRRSWWQFSARELRIHAILYAIAAWAFAAVLLFGGHGLRTIAGVLKFQDFVYFYTLGHLALQWPL